MAWHLWCCFSFINDDIFYGKALGIGASEFTYSDLYLSF